MNYRIISIIACLMMIFIFSCTPVEENTTDEITPDNPTENTDKTPDDATEVTSETIAPDHYICYKSDEDGSSLSISIGFDEKDKALQVRYLGQEESIPLSIESSDTQAEGAYPTDETLYAEMLNGKKNGTYKLTHSGNWDYAEYTRAKDGKVFKFTIDHELTISGGGYRTTPCY